MTTEENPAAEIGERSAWGAKLRDPCEIDRQNVLAVQHGFGFASRKRNNVHLLNERGVLLTTLGSTAAILDTHANTVEYIFCPDGQGIGCCCVHPSRKFFAIGGQGNRPNVYIYSFPNRRLVRILRGGTERAYSCMNFSSSGEKLATVGASPDFLLTVWDWDTEKIILRNKAFSQEIYNVSFAPGKDGFLMTSGLGHIRFWKMADTFTGLKLQGDIGKFGKVELSDVSAYAVMPDAKVLSGSESGSLLLWDGNFIKLEIRRPNEELPHVGEIHVCKLIGAENPATAQFLTSGEDGWLRWWSMKDVDTAEVTDEDPFFIIKPIREVQIEGKVPISICVGEGYIILQDRNGGIYRLDEPIFPGSDCIQLREGHSGHIAGVATSPIDHIAVTVAGDCTVRAWDYEKGLALFQRKFNAAPTSVMWMPPVFDMSGQSLLVGFADGVLRQLSADRSAEDFRLTLAMKPHNEAVTCMAIDENATRLATAGAEGNVFIFDIQRDGKFTPLGFIVAPSKVSGLQWTCQGDRILFSCSQGRVIEVTLPHPTNGIPKPNTHHTFELKDLPTRTFTFKRRVPKPLEKPKPVVEETEEGGMPSTTTSSSKAAQEEEADPQQIEFERLQALPVGSVLTFRIVKEVDDKIQFVISLDGADAGPLFLCEFGTELPLRVLPNLAADDGVNMDSDGGTDLLTKDPLAKFLPGMNAYPSCTLVAGTWSGNFLLNGSSTGEIHIRPFDSLCSYAAIRVHDGIVGKVTGAQTSFDDSFLITAAADGSLFAHRLNALELVNRCKDLDGKPGNRIKAKKLWIAEAQAKASGQPMKDSLDGQLSGEPGYIGTQISLQESFPKPESPPEPPGSTEEPKDDAPDITDPAAYSIQDDKLKTEEDNKFRLAEIEKDKVRQVIQDLRQDFEALLKENENDDPETQLPRDAFDIDNELIASLMEEGKQQLEEVIKETQWNVNLSKAKLEKLKRFFLNGVLVDSISLAAFNEKYSVQSFRTAKFSETLQSAVATLHEVLNGSGPNQRANGSENGDGEHGTSHGGVGARPETESGSDSPSRSKGKKKEGATGWEARKAGRRDRKIQMQQLLETKPDENADDPLDVAAIDWVLNNMGDYKLKSAANYQVPADQQVNAAKKHRQSVLLAESIQELRMKFNEKFLALRELKRRIVEQARQDEARVHHIDDELGEKPTSLGLPLRLDGCEWPEKRMELAPEEMETFLRGEIALASLPGGVSARSGNAQNPDMFCKAALRSVCADAKTEFEKEVWSTKRKQLFFEKSQILQRSLDAVQAFDSAIYELRKERAQLEADLVAAELRQILLFREQQLLNEFEKKDNSLSTKLDSCRQQKSEVLAEITSCQENLAAKKAELAIWQEKDRVIMEEFNSIVGGDSNPAAAQLLKIFKRKIKRVKQSGEGESDDEDSDDDDDEDYDDEEEDFEEGEPEEERCPDGCDPAIYEKVLELREKRLDQEEVLTAFNKSIEELRKSNERHQGREKQIDKDLKNTVVEIQAFQNEKQRKLNEVDAFMVLRLAQLACLVEPEGDGSANNTDADLDRALQALEEEGEDAIEFTEDEKIDTGDKDIQELKSQLAFAREQLVALDEAVEANPEDDSVIERQDEVTLQAKHLQLAIRRARIDAERTRRLKARLVLPTSIGSALVFDKDTLHDLHAGIGRLLDENRDKKLEFKDLHHMQKRLKRDKKQKLDDIAALEDKCRDLQLLKFGQEIDLDTIEKMGSTGTADVRGKLNQQESKQQTEQSRAQKDISTAQERLLEETQRNSMLLQQIVNLTEKQQHLELELNRANGGASHMGHGLVSHREAQETAQLTQLVKLQSNEIQALKAEINMLRGNSGNMFPNRNQIMDP